VNVQGGHDLPSCSAIIDADVMADCRVVLLDQILRFIEKGPQLRTFRSCNFEERTDMAF
jgi:hypothetical protein